MPWMLNRELVTPENVKGIVKIILSNLQEITDTIHYFPEKYRHGKAGS